MVAYIFRRILKNNYAKFDAALTTYLPLPFVPGFGDLLVSIAHHSDQHVYEQDRYNCHVQYKQYLQLIAIVFDWLAIALRSFAWRVCESSVQKFV